MGSRIVLAADLRVGDTLDLSRRVVILVRRIDQDTLRVVVEQGGAQFEHRWRRTTPVKLADE